MQRKRFGEVLVDMGVLTPADVDRVLTAMDRRGDALKFGQTARKMGLLGEEQILAALAVQMELVPDALRHDIRTVLSELSRPVKGGTSPVRKRPVPLLPRLPR